MKKVFSFISVFFISLVFNNKVKADISDYLTEVDVTGYSIESKVEDSRILKMYLKGITKTEKTFYYVYFSNSNTELPTISEGASGCGIVSDNGDLSKFKDVFDDGRISINNDYYLLKGYQYAYVVKSVYQDDDKWHCEIAKTPVTVEKAKLPNLGERYSYFNSTNDKNKYDVNKKFPYDNTSSKMGDHKLSTKIGLIKDNNLLKKLSKSESGSLEELLDYAKTNDGSSYTYQDEDYYPIDISKINIVNGKYYYIYTTYTDNLYRDLSDVVVYMAKDGELTDEVFWNIEEENKEIQKKNEPKSNEKVEEKEKNEKTEEIKNPKTGIEKPYVLLTVVLVISELSYGIIKRKKLFSK